MVYQELIQFIFITFNDTYFLFDCMIWNILIYKVPWLKCDDFCFAVVVFLDIFEIPKKRWIWTTFIRKNEISSDRLMLVCWYEVIFYFYFCIYMVHKTSCGSHIILLLLVWLLFLLTSRSGYLPRKNKTSWGRLNC